jgi:uncharacterized protein (DUF2236 family)
MTPGPSAVVTEADLERELVMVRSTAAGESAGIFGPGSVSWRLDREAAVFLGAGRALLLQLAHPWVAAAIVEHSRSLNDPIGRFQRTFNVTLTMMFGTTTQAVAAARKLHRRHAGICGALSESSEAYSAGSAYKANDLAALRWVWATLIETAPLAYELIAPILSIEDRERYYVEARLFAALFGIPQDALPQSWADFAGYVDQMLASDVLTASDAARSIAAELFAGWGSLANPAMVWSADRWFVAASSAAGFRLGLRPGGASLGEAGNCRASLRISVDTVVSALCRAIPRGSFAACRARAARGLDAGAEPLLDRANFNGDGRKLILWDLRRKRSRVWRGPH